MEKMTENERAFIEQLQDAAIQMHLMQNWAADEEFKARGGKILYAVDADIFSTYGDPFANANRRDRRIGYGQVFRTDKEEIGAAITARLMDHVFFKLNPTLPLMIIPPIETEIAVILNAIEQKLGKEPPNTWFDIDQIRQAVEDFKGSKKLPTDIYERILKIVYIESGPGAEYRRLTRLLESGRIVSPRILYRDYRDNAIFGDRLNPVFSKLFAPSQSEVVDIIDHSLRKDAWYSDLIAGETRTIPTRQRIKIEQDADALSRLEGWNFTLTPHKYRIVYITGSAYILRAVHTSSSARRNDFGDKYIRHPRFFLAAPDVLKIEQFSDDDSSEFFGLIQTFLAHYDVGNSAAQILNFDDPLGESEREKALRALHTKPDIGADVRARWRVYSEWVRQSYESPPEVRRKILDDVGNIGGVRSVLVEWERVRANLDSQLNDAIDKSWEACFSVATKSGLWFLYSGDNGAGLPNRTVPALCLDHGVQTQAFLDNMSHWHNGIQADSALYDRGLQAMKVEYRSENGQKYVYYLLHAVLFASRARWKVAELLTERALTFVEREVTIEGDRTNGREAYFLAAWCYRHAVKLPKELDHAQDFINRARAIYERESALEVRERERTGGDASRSFGVLPERFLAEELAIESSRLFFLKFPPRNDDEFNGSNDETASGVSCSCIEWEAKANSTIFKHEELTEALERRITDSREGSKTIRDMLRLVVRLQTNECALLYCTSQLEMRRDRLRVCIENIGVQQLDGAAASGDKNFFRESILLTGRALLGYADVRAREIEWHFSEPSIKQYSIFSYDSFRFEKMKVLALSAIKSRR